MTYRSGVMIWLCLILCFIHPITQGQDASGAPAQITGGNAGGGSGKGKGRRGRFGKGKGKGFRNRFGKGKGTGPRNSQATPIAPDNNTPNVQYGTADPQGQTDPATQFDTATAAAALTSNFAAPTSTSAPPISTSTAPTSTSVVPASTSAATLIVPSDTSATTTHSSSTFIPPTSMTSAFPDPSSSTATAHPSPAGANAGIAIPTTSSLSSQPVHVAPLTTASLVSTSRATIQSITAPGSLSSEDSIVTTSMRAQVTPAVAASEVASEPTSASPMSLSPLPASSSATLTVVQQAGIGVGITLGVLGIAGVAGLYLWRRRRNRKVERRHDRTRVDTSRAVGGCGSLGGFLRLLSRSVSTTDAEKKDECSVDSVEKVETMRGRPSSVRSIRTASSSYSLNDPSALTETKPSVLQPTFSPLSFPMFGTTVPRKVESGVAPEVLKLSMKVPERKPWPNPALTSNPISPSVFSSSPMSGSRSLKRSGERTGSWPLPEGT